MHMNYPLDHDHTLVVPWISQGHRAVWNNVLHLGRKTEWKDRSIVIYPEDDTNCIYYLYSGMIKVTAASSEGLQRTLWLQGPGSVIGEAAMFTGKPFLHFFTTIEKCVVYRFSKETVLKRLIPDHPSICEALLTNLANKSYIMSSQVEESTFLCVRKRIGRFLYGLCLAQNTTKLLVTHALIADLLGIHRVTVTNTIGLMKKNGLLENVSQGVVVRDIRGLEAFINQADLLPAANG